MNQLTEIELKNPREYKMANGKASCNFAYRVW